MPRMSASGARVYRRALIAFVCTPATAIAAAGGWLGFDRYMAMALYEPGLGYYTRGTPVFGTMPGSGAGRGSDFVTAPEMSAVFGRTLARQVAQALQATGTREVLEFGAGSGALAEHLLDATLDEFGGALATPSSMSPARCVSARR